MPTLKQLTDNDIQTARSFLTQLVDVIQEDISGSSTRRKYQVFVTGGIGPGVTSSLFQTVYDQDFTLQTANPVLDMTVGLFFSGSSVTLPLERIEESTNQFIFGERTMMMREKIDIYKEYAKSLLGDAEKGFYAPFTDTSAADSKDNSLAKNLTGLSGINVYKGAGSKERIDEALFVNFKRLFHRDGIKKETFAFKFFTTASRTDGGGLPENHGFNLDLTTETGSIIFSDAGSSNKSLSTKAGGRLGEIVNSSNTNEKVGLIFYDKGVAVLDMRKIMSGGQHVSGVIDGMNALPYYAGLGGPGKLVIGDVGLHSSSNKQASFIPDLVISASIDDIVDHVASCRFSSGAFTSFTFQNNTEINSTLYFCRATADEFNYSSNSTFIDSEGQINVIDAGSRDGTQKAFTYVTSIGLHDAQGNLLAVAKLSRPVEKNSEKDVTFRVRLDF